MADFYESIPTVLANEGGYTFDSSDPGGETKFGISKRSYPHLNIKSLTVIDATAIYLRDFWLFGGIEDQAVATKLFDSYVNMKHTAITLIQKLIGVEADGVYGPKTEEKINQEDPNILLKSYKMSLIHHYQALVKQNPMLGKFLVGWLRRAQQ
jgi:lysozyme family protein